MSPSANPCSAVNVNVSAPALRATVASTPAPVTSAALAPLLVVNECVPVDQFAAVRLTVLPNAMASVVMSTAASPSSVTNVPPPLACSELVPVFQGAATSRSTT